MDAGNSVGQQSADGVGERIAHMEHAHTPLQLVSWVVC